MSDKWMCGKCAREVAQGVDDGQIPEHHRTCPKRAQTEPTEDEREALPIAPRETWDWDTCVVCGSKEVSDRGMVIMGASNGAPYAARIAWCDQSQECREDLRQTSFLLTEPDVKVIDGFRRPAQAEPTDAQAIAARDELQRRGYGGASLFAMRAALRAAFTAGQERAAEAQPRGKSCAVNACRHAARWQDSGAVDYCACHYDDSAPDEECTAGQEDKL